MTILEPDWLNIRLRFTYRECKVEIDQRIHQDRPLFVAWVHYSKGCAIATSNAPTKTVAVRRAKDWIDQKLTATT